MDSNGPKHTDKYGSRLSPVQISVRVPRTPSVGQTVDGLLIPDISSMQQHGFPITQQIRII